MSIAQQIATPVPAPRTRRPSAPLQAAPVRRPGYTIVRIMGLVAVTALGAAMLAGAAVLGVMMLASSLGA